MECVKNINTFHNNGLFLCSLKALKNLWFSVFQGVLKVTSAMKCVKDVFNKYVSAEC